MMGREGLGSGKGWASKLFPAVCRLSSEFPGHLRTFVTSSNWLDWLSSISGFLRDNLAIVEHFRNLDPFRTAMPHRVLANVKIVDIQKRKVPSKHYVSIQVWGPYRNKLKIIEIAQIKTVIKAYLSVQWCLRSPFRSLYFGPLRLKWAQVRTCREIESHITLFCFGQGKAS